MQPNLDNETLATDIEYPPILEIDLTLSPRYCSGNSRPNIKREVKRFKNEQTRTYKLIPPMRLQRIYLIISPLSTFPSPPKPRHENLHSTRYLVVISSPSLLPLL